MKASKEGSAERGEEVMAGRVVLGIALLAFAVIVYFRWIPSYYGLVDEQGYLTTAKQLATHGEFARTISDPYAFVGETMMQSPRDARVYYLRQPIGYPVLCAAAYFLGGADAPFAVNPLMGLALIVGIYVVGKELGSGLLGAMAGLVVALHPLVWYYTLMALSHVPDMAAAVWAVGFALLWRREGKVWQAVLAAGVLGLAVWVRYTNVLLVLPLGVIVVERWRREGRRALVHVGIAAGVFGVMLVPLAVYQAAAFGSVLKTGYSAGGNATSFSWGYLVAHAPAMGEILMRPGMGLSVMLVGVAIGVVVMARRDRWTLVMLLLWAVPPLVLYTAYYGIPSRNMLLYARFTLSSLVPLVLMGVMWAKEVRGKAAVVRGVVVAIVGVTIGLNYFNGSMGRALDSLENEMLFAMTTGRAVTQAAPAGSVIVAGDVTHYFLDYAGEYVVYEPGMFEIKRVEARVADLERQPHEFDPARTKQIAALLGGKTDGELIGILRERLKGYSDRGKGVYVVIQSSDAGIYARAMGTSLTPLTDTGLGVTVYRMEFGR